MSSIDNYSTKLFLDIKEPNLILLFINLLLVAELTMFFSLVYIGHYIHYSALNTFQTA